MARLLALGIAALLAGAGCAESRGPKSAVVVVLDTLRADRLGAYGYERPTSPRIDALAAEGVLFERATTHAPWTLPAMVALLAGQYPTAEVFQGGMRSSLVEALKEAGFATAAFTEGGFVSRDFGLDAGFDVFWEQAHPALAADPPPADSEGFDSGRTFVRAAEWLEGVQEAPFFLLIHTYEPHMPYRRTTFAEGLPRGGIGETFEVPDRIEMTVNEYVPSVDELSYVRALYDGGVLEADRLVGELLDALEVLGLAEETLVVVTSDHGEDLGHRDPADLAKHGHHLFDELLHVPLVVYDPTRRYPSSRVSAQVRLVDVMPTVLEMLRVPSASRPYGRSLLPLMLGEEVEDRIAFARITPHPLVGRIRLLALRSDTHKLIVEPTAGGELARIELYDLLRDPQERRNVAGVEEELALRHLRDLREIADDLRSRGLPNYVPAAGAREEDVREQLRALGYIEE